MRWAGGVTCSIGKIEAALRSKQKAVVAVVVSIALAARLYAHVKRVCSGSSSVVEIRRGHGRLSEVRRGHGRLSEVRRGHARSREPGGVTCSVPEMEGSMKALSFQQSVKTKMSSAPCR